MPFKQPPHRSITLATARLLKKLFNPPKRRRNRTVLGPIKTRSQFQAVHEQVHQKIIDYTACRRPAYKKLAPFVARDMSANYAKYMQANNFKARIDLAENVVRHLTGEPALQVEPIFLVTIVSGKYVVPMKDALAMSLKDTSALIFSLQQLTRQALQGLSHVSMVELALYKDWTIDGPRPGRDSVHWHSHAIVFGSNLRQIGRATRQVRSRHKNIYGGKAVHCRQISVAELALYARYMMKAPLKEYRLHKQRGEWIDAETGEVFVRFGVRQTKRDLRTGDRVQLANVMDGLLLDKLLFGGGVKGKALAKAIKHEALTPLLLEKERCEDKGEVWRV